MMHYSKDYSVTRLNLRTFPLVEEGFDKELPKDIHLYKNLKKLYCYNNQLTTLPENLPVSLEVLGCNNNQLTTLPENFPVSLKYLHCNNNQLTTLPENLPVSLKLLFCDNNPFTKEYDFEITTETLPRYYLEKEEREKSRGYGMYNAIFK
jgi:hypothetical protein